MNLVNATEVVVNGLTNSLFVALPAIRSASAACHPFSPLRVQTRFARYV